jgi:hypothetical protein
MPGAPNFSKLSEQLFGFVIIPADAIVSLPVG